MRSIIIDESPIQIYGLGINGMMEDNFKCIYSGCKIIKKLARNQYLFDNFDEPSTSDNRNVSDFNTERILAELREMGIKEDQVKHYSIDDLRQHLTEDNNELMIELKGDVKPDAKVYLESLATSVLNSDGDVFYSMIKVIKKVIARIMDTKELEGLMESGKVICLMKGGMASRHILINTYGKPVIDVDRIYGNGDCDFGFMVSEDLPKVDAICYWINMVTYEVLKDLSPVDVAIVIGKVYSIRSININGEMISCRPNQSRCFKKTTNNAGSSVVMYDGDRKSVRATNNYINANGLEFYLSRLKTDFYLHDVPHNINGCVSAEVLDISVSKCDLSKLDLVAFN